MKKLLMALGFALLAGSAHAASGQFGDPTDTLNEYVTVLNADAVAHEVGDIVVWSDLSTMTVSTTTSANLRNFAGVVAFKDLAANGKGLIQTFGYHSAISIGVANSSGDCLGTSTTAEVAGVTTTAGACIAVALEATTSSTTVKGLIRGY